MSWFIAEDAGLLAVVRLAADAGFTTHAWQLAWIVSPYFLRRGLGRQYAAQQAAQRAARAAGDVPGEAHAAHGLALGYARSGRFNLAVPVFERALGLYQAIGDHTGQARVQDSLTWIAERRGAPRRRGGPRRRTLAFYRAIGDRGGGRALTTSAFATPGSATIRRRSTIASKDSPCREVGARNWEAATLDSLGFIHDGLGDHGRAVGYYEQAAAVFRELGDRFNEADTLVSSAMSWPARTDRSRARQVDAGLRIFDEIGHPDGDDVRARLEEGGGA